MTILKNKMKEVKKRQLKREFSHLKERAIFWNEINVLKSVILWIVIKFINVYELTRVIIVVKKFQLSHKPKKQASRGFSSMI